jgi:thiol:disulfide interchange protein DsbD
MSYRQAGFALTIIMGLAAPVAAQPGDLGELLGAKKPSGRAPKAKFSAVVTPDKAAPGDTVTVAVTAKLPRDYYIYGTDGTFAGRTLLKITVTGAEPLDDWRPDHEGKAGVDPEQQLALTKFFDEVTWSRSYRLTATSGSATFSGTLAGQYCSNAEAGGECRPILPPFKYDLAVEIASASPLPTETVASAPASPYEQLIIPTRPKRDGPKPDGVRYRVWLEPTTAVQGEPVRLNVTATHEAGWHTYATTQPQDQTGGYPTEIADLAVRNLTPVGDSFEPDRPYTEKPAGDGTLLIHTDVVTWSREYRATTDHPGDYGIDGTITYVLCDDKSCLPVKEVPFTVGLFPEGPPDQPGAVVAEVTPADDPNSDEESPSPFTMTDPPEPESTESIVAVGDDEPPGIAALDRTLAFLDGAETQTERPQDRGLIPFLLLCLGGGFLALLTPCSFPMVPITVSFFLKQSEQSHRRPWVLAVVYCASIVLAFTVLGVGISAIFGATQLNQLANNPWVNLMIGAVFVAFAFNMLGAFEIRVPTSLLTWSAMHEGGGSYLGAVFMALTFTLTSFTCTFAVAGSLLVAASQGEIYWPVIGMLAFGAAFASPFFVLALIPSLLKKLPKSGGWMNSVKVVMGLIEVGAAVKFFSVADLAWNPEPLLLDYTMTMLIWMTLALAIAAYLFGWFQLSHDMPVQQLTTGRASLAIAFLGLTLLLGNLILQPDGTRNVLTDQVIAFAPPRLTGGRSELGPVLDHHGLLFALDLKQAQPVAAKRRQPLLLDFTGVNCVNCRRMEKKMDEPANKERIAKYIAVQLYADKVPTITNDEQAAGILQNNLDLQVNWFGDVALPSYAVVSPDGQSILAAYSGYERSEGEFTRFLDYAWNQWEAFERGAGTTSTTRR